MKELIDNNGNLLDNDDAIKEYVLNIFLNTFKRPELGMDIINFEDFCKKYKVILPSIDADFTNYLKHPINKHSISWAIFNPKNLSAGSPDGITSLLLKDLHKWLQDLVQNAFLEELINDNLGLKYREILLIEKKTDTDV